MEDVSIFTLWFLIWKKSDSIQEYYWIRTTKRFKMLAYYTIHGFTRFTLGLLTFVLKVRKALLFLVRPAYHKMRRRSSVFFDFSSGLHWDLWLLMIGLQLSSWRLWISYFLAVSRHCAIIILNTTKEGEGRGTPIIISCGRYPWKYALLLRIQLREWRFWCARFLQYAASIGSNAD